MEDGGLALCTFVDNILYASNFYGMGRTINEIKKS